MQTASSYRKHQVRDTPLHPFPFHRHRHCRVTPAPVRDSKEQAKFRDVALGQCRPLDQGRLLGVFGRNKAIRFYVRFPASSHSYSSSQIYGAPYTDSLSQTLSGALGSSGIRAVMYLPFRSHIR